MSSSRRRRWSWTVMTGSGVVSRRRSRAGAAIGDAALGDGVEERPGGVRHHLRDERPDVLLAHGVERPVEGELVELPDGERAHPLAVHVALVDEPADAPRELLRRRGLELHPALRGPGDDPARELARPRRLERARLAAGLEDRGLKAAERRGSLVAGVTLLEEHERVARRDGPDRRLERLAVRLRAEEGGRVDDDRHRAAPEQRRRSPPARRSSAAVVSAPVTRQRSGRAPVSCSIRRATSRRPGRATSHRRRGSRR